VTAGPVSILGRRRTRAEDGEELVGFGLMRQDTRGARGQLADRERMRGVVGVDPDGDLGMAPEDRGAASDEVSHLRSRQGAARGGQQHPRQRQ
jgi:hypothetical protein